MFHFDALNGTSAACDAALQLLSCALCSPQQQTFLAVSPPASTALYVCSS
jgi:hypothetical protein